MKRREFFRTSGGMITSVSMRLPAASATRFPWDTEVLNVGVIGTGDRGSGLIKVMKEIPQLRVIAGCDILPFRLENGLEHADPNAKAYHDYRALLENNQIDAVLIATPLYLHTQMAADALEAGKHVYCEKTMAYNPEQTRRLVRNVKQYPKQTFQVGYQYHHSRLYQQVGEIIQNGYIGTVTGFECQWNRNGDWRRVVPDPKYERIINWRMYRDYSCGLLGELSSHQIDFVNWVTQAHPLRVVGSGGIDYWKDGRETYDNVHVIFDYPQGIKARFTCTTANAYEGYQINVLGDQATVVIKPDKAWIYPEETEKESATVDGVSGATKSMLDEHGAIPIKVDHAEPSKQALLDFAENVFQQKEPVSNWLAGAKASYAVHMALQSMLQQRSIAWQESYDLS